MPPEPLFDTHCHYNLSPLWDDWSTFLAAARAAGVRHSVVVGTNVATAARAAELAAVQPDFFRASLGLHPELVADWLARSQGNPVAGEQLAHAQLAQLADLAARARFQAWGEMGLDFYRLDRASPDFVLIQAGQVELLRQQLLMARAHPLPIILHVRDDPDYYEAPDGAYRSVLRLLAATGAAEQPVIFHCFSGSAAYLAAALELPHSFISFAGNITFKSAHALRALAQQVPAERLLVETDSPFLAPEPCRGQFCQPAFLTHTAALVSQVTGVPLAQLYQNSLTIWGQSRV